MMLKKQSKIVVRGEKADRAADWYLAQRGDAAAQVTGVSHLSFAIGNALRKAQRTRKPQIVEIRVSDG